MALAQSSGNAVPLVCGYLLNEHGILTAPVFNHSDVLRIEPPLIITTAQIDRLFVALEAAAKLLSRGDYARLFGHITAPTGPRGAPPEDQDFATPRYPIVPPSASERRLGKFVFFVHPTEFDDLVRSQPPAFDYFTPDQKEAWHAWLTSWCAKRYDPGVVYHMPALRSKQGGYAEGWLVSCALTPAQMMRLSPRERNELMADYLAVARDLEPDIVGLGAFTSIITRCGQDIVDCGLNITTGNSLTAMASAESLKIAAALQGMDLTQVKTGVIGASGSVGRLACKKLISTCTDLTLFGNPTNPHALKNLEVLAGELYRDAISRWREAGPVGIGKTLAAGLPNAHWLPEELMGESAEARRNLYRAVSTYFADLGREAPIKITVDLKTKLPEIGAMISATSQGQAFIDPDYLAPNAIVCDSARPPDVRASVRETRPDVFVYEGGLVKLPQPVRFGVNNCISLPTGINLACLCETIALAMGGERRHYSLGTEVPLAEAEEVYALALAHGFEVSLLDSYGEILTGETGTLLEQQAQHRVRRS
jgi:predicted amino acid dehydrogenase